MPNISRTKTWNANETLTAADLNAEYNGILTGVNDNALNNDNLNQTDDYLFGSLITGSGLAAAGGDGKLHVHVASAGSVAAHANGNDFVIEGTANPGMSFLSGASTTNSIYFGDVNDNDAGSIVYTHGADMAFTVETAEVLSLSASTITALAGITVGVDDAGHDVKIFGNAAGAYMEWDTSADQLRIMGASADAVTSTGKLLLATSLTNINANDVLGKIDFQAPHEAGGTDAITIAASIQAIAQGTFAADLNATDLIFYTGHSEAATEKFRMTSQGEIGIGGANYGTDGHVLTSGGAGAAVAWEAAATVTLPFYTVVSGETIQTQVNAAEAAGGGKVMVGPGTYNENVLIDSDNVSLIGAGWGCTTINGAAAGYAVKIAADHCRVEGFTVNTTAGGGHADGEGVWIAAGSYNVVAFCRSVTSDKTAFFGNGAGTRNMWLHNVIPADNHDGYAAIDSSLSGDDNLIMGNIVQSGGLLGYTSGGDYTVMVGNILDGNGANSYGYILGTAAANSLMVGNISHDVSSTDFWDQGGTGTNTANEVL